MSPGDQLFAERDSLGQDRQSRSAGASFGEGICADSHMALGRPGLDDKAGEDRQTGLPRLRQASGLGAGPVGIKAKVVVEVE
jgi:hypothetical protein